MKILGMEVYRRKTDEEFIETIRRMFPRSKWFYWFGLLPFLFGIAIYFVVLSMFIRLENSFSDLNARPGISIGIGLGLFMGIILTMTGWSLASYIIRIKNIRTERLLLRYHDELKALGRIPKEEPALRSESELWS